MNASVRQKNPINPKQMFKLAVTETDHFSVTVSNPRLWYNQKSALLVHLLNLRNGMS